MLPLRRHPQTHQSRRRQVCQLEPVLQPVLPRGQMLRQLRLRHVVHLQHPVLQLQTRILRLQLRHHAPVHQILHLERHARQRNQRLPPLLEPHPRGSPLHIPQHTAPLRQPSLRAVPLIHRQAPVAQQLLQPPQRLPVLHQPHPEILRQHLLRHIILRRAQAPRHHNQIRRPHRIIHRIVNLLPPVRHGQHLHHLHAYLCQPPGNIPRIGIQYLPHQNLVSNRNYNPIHNIFSLIINPSSLIVNRSNRFSSEGCE